MKSILHISSLEKIGGHELSLCDLLESKKKNFQFCHTVYALGNKIHPYLSKRIKKHSRAFYLSRSSYGVNTPLIISKLKFELLKKHINPSLIVFWNCIGIINEKYNWLYHADIPYIHFERGNIESTTYDHIKSNYLNHARLIIANSFSTSRHIALRFKPNTSITICLNSLPTNLENSYGAKFFPKKRPFRIGVCGRLEPIKGFALTIQALKCLKKHNAAIELHIAGTGAEEKNLYYLASQINVADQVTFHGLLNFKSLVEFYRDLDLLIVPSIREPFGKVSIEAQFMGCPVIVSKVDGLPETIEHGVTGYCITPTLDINDYIKMGGSRKGLPEYVYNPDEDSLVPPKALNPERLAEKLMFILQNPDLYEKLSQNAYNTAKERFSHEKHIKEIWKLFEEAMGNSRHHP